jgi:predicted metal-binding protein
MSRPTIFICRSCQGDGESSDGDALYERVKRLRKSMHLQNVFELDSVKCLGLCDTPCAVEFSGKKRSTYLRGNVNAVGEAELLVHAAVSYASLLPGTELPERKLPGVDVP